jgi:hypothetical protein
MTMRVRIRLLAFEHCWSISAGSCLTTLLTALITLRADYHMFAYLKIWLGSHFQQKLGVDGRCQNVAVLTGAEFLD